MKNYYPASPTNVPLNVTAPSSNFKKEVKKVMVSISLFFIVYFILIAISIVLAIACVYAGFFVIANSGHFFGIIAGIGIISIGIMVFGFLIKFIFSVTKYDEAGSIEINEKEHPVLFDFIRQLTNDTQTRFPKKIVLSPEVNACVFYNDSFWSMLFPVRKNLQIGLGLVNSLTLSEFKAVMAHEFGHFSQRSMKLGSFVYNVNKAIYNMLYENKDFSSFLQGLGSLHAVIGIFVWITVQIVVGIQKILQAMYGFINKNYMGLSREMEFHADAVAASVSGSYNCTSALRKLEIGEVCYQAVLQKANELLKDNTRLENIYQNHNEAMYHYASHNNLVLENNVPVADEAFFNNFKNHKINIRDQWASHPPREERSERLEKLNVIAVKDIQPAWLLFNDKENLQKELTNSLYRFTTVNPDQKIITASAFKEIYSDEMALYKLPKAYNGFYDDRQMNEMDFDEVCARPFSGEITIKGFESLFNNEWSAITKKIAGNEYDSVMLKAIIEKQVDVKSFDYDGKKSDRQEAVTLIETITTESEKLKKDIQHHEESIFSFFYNAALLSDTALANSIKEKYQHHFSFRKFGNEFLEIGQEIMGILSPLFGGKSVNLEDAAHMAKELRTSSEKLKPFIKKIMADNLYADKELLKKAENFVTADYQYYHNPSFIDVELDCLHLLVTESLACLNKAQFISFKELLVYQLAIFEKVSNDKNE